MKKIFAVLVAICMMASMLCVAAVPVSAGGDYTASVCGLSADGLEWAIGIYENFEDAWNEAIYYATHLEEAWNSSIRYESEEERPAEEGFTHIIVNLYGDWNADGNGTFGSGIGFRDGAIYVPSNARIIVDLGGHCIRRGLAGDEANGEAMYIDAGADVKISNGTIIGGLHTDKNAKADVSNVYVAGGTPESRSVPSRFASIFGEGSLTNILLIISLVASGISIFLTVYYNKKKAAPVAANNATEADDEE